jgi:hypothetical protein
MTSKVTTDRRFPSISEVYPATFTPVENADPPESFGRVSVITRQFRAGQLRAEPEDQSAKSRFQSPYPLVSSIGLSVPVYSTTSPRLVML